jgi:HAD superfamily hydrolase (TIGR01509 family)
MGAVLMERRVELSRVSAIVFDLDGTLLDSVDAHVESWIKAFEKHGIKGISKDELYKLIGLPGQVIVERIGGVYAIENYRSISEIKDAMFIKLINRGIVKIYPDAEDTLIELRDRGYKLGLSTSTPRYMLEKISSLVKIEKYFDAVVAGDEVEKGKPHPEIFIKVFEKLEIDPKRGMVVGDSEYDIIPAREIGAVSVLVNYRGRSMYSSWKEKPDIVIGRISDLLKIL